VSANALILLKFLAAQGEGALVSSQTFLQHSQFSDAVFEAAVKNLLQRELIESVNPHHYRFQVELIRRWFSQ
jgi:hypothetical protein